MAVAAEERQLAAEPQPEMTGGLSAPPGGRPDPSAPPLAAPPCSPPLPPLQPSSSPVLPRPSSSHRRFHSALPLGGVVTPRGGAASGQLGGWQQLEGGAAHDRSFSMSITGSHIDFHLGGRSPSSPHASALGAAAEPPSPSPLRREPSVAQQVAAVPPSAASSTRLEVGCLSARCSCGSSSLPPAWCARPACPAGPRALPQFAAASCVQAPHQVGVPPGTYLAAAQRFEQVNISAIKRHIQPCPGGAGPLRRRLPLPGAQNHPGRFSLNTIRHRFAYSRE